MQNTITGVILAGGAGRRVGNRDKGLILLDGRPLVTHVLDGLKPQVGEVIVSCNRNREAYRAYSPTVVADRRDNFQGPLSGLESVAPHVQTDFVAVVSCDMPYLPPGWVQRLAAAMCAQAGDTVSITYAHDGDRAQYLCAMIRRECLSTLGSFLDAGHRAVRDWFERQAAVAVDFFRLRELFQELQQAGLKREW